MWMNARDYSAVVAEKVLEIGFAMLVACILVLSLAWETSQLFAGDSG